MRIRLASTILGTRWVFGTDMTLNKTARPALIEANRIDDLPTRLVELAHTPVLLVATDFDGTLAPIVSEPSLAKPNRKAIAALHSLAMMPQTHAAVISGRALHDLTALSGASKAIHLVGSHGCEFDSDFGRGLDPALAELRDRILRELTAIADAESGFLVETKPASVALHYRNASELSSERAIARISRGSARDHRVQVKHGKKVVEFSVVKSDKGTGLAAIRRRVGATAVLFMGDDRTDEDAFSMLRSSDVAVKVGEGPTGARFRVSDCTEVAEVLASLSALREEWSTRATGLDT